VEIFEDPVWQMSLGERAAVEGVLCQLEPALAIEIGTAEGASLRRIAAHAQEVHSFDLVAPALEVPPNVTLHPGDSHQLLPELLEQLAGEGRNVDFALVDGDHSSEGVQRDIEDLLNSDAVKRTVILIHDVNNEQVRRGVDAVRYRAWGKVHYVELDWVPGYMFREERLRHELWGGLGLVVVDSSKPAYPNPQPLQQRYYDAGHLFAELRDIVVARETDLEAARTGELGELRDRVEELEQQLASEARLRRGLESSVSWKITRPLRTAMAKARRAFG
jgi:Methyltransferase domain